MGDSAMRYSAGIAFLVIAGLAGCQEPLPTFEVNDEPMVYVVLHPGMDVYEPGTMREYGLLATVGTPVESDFIRATAFDMTDATGTGFAWTECAIADLHVTPEGLDIREANYCLGAASGSEAGAAALVEGASYDLRITLADGSVISGHTAVPDAFTIRHDPATRTISWGTNANASAYSWVITHASGSLSGNLSGDTTVALPESVTGGTITVHAFDANLHAYLSDGEARSAGVTGARGVFGSVVASELTF